MEREDSGFIELMVYKNYACGKQIYYTELCKIVWNTVHRLSVIWNGYTYMELFELALQKVLLSTVQYVLKSK